MSSRKEKRRPWRVLLTVFAVLSAVGVLTLAVLWGITLREIDGEMDEALFAAAGKDTVTRLYYHGSGGACVAGLPDYRAVEWESEAVSGDTVCLHTPLAEMPSYLPQAFIAIEDHRFYSHHGVDVRRTGMAALNTVFRFSSRFGGSTITQQLVKNIGGEREITAKRKWREMVRAVRMEQKHSKEEILEAYLNIVPLSGGCVGVGAAARRLFGKQADELSLAECAGLAAITCAPSALDPERHPEAYRARRDVVLAQMRRYGMIDETSYRAAVAEEVHLNPKAVGGEEVHSWYTETVLSDVRAALCARGYTEAAATALLYRGGLRIYTCADPAVQGALEKDFATAPTGVDHAAMIVLDPRTGHLLGIVGGIGAKTGDRLQNHATDTLRPPGSALKPVALYAPAIEQGLITEVSVFDDVPRAVQNGSPWPRNASAGYAGLTCALHALRDSRNTVAVELYERLGAEKIYAHLSRELGISTLCHREEREGRVLTDLAPSPLALGQLSHGVSLRELTAAYLPLADGGMMHTCRSFLMVTEADGTPILTDQNESRRVFTAATAAVMTHMLGSVVKEGSAASLTVDEMVALVGKTGTSSGAKDRWFIGYTPHLLTGIWCGSEQGGVPVGAQLGLYDAAMRRVCAARGDEGAAFSVPTGLKRVRVCCDSGCLPGETCRLDPRGDRTIEVLLPTGVIPTAVCQCHVLSLYDTVEGGVVPPEWAERYKGEARLCQTALLRLPKRELPPGVIVADAEYGCYSLEGEAPTEQEDRPYFATLFSADVNLGIGTMTPYNRLSPLCYHTIEEDEKEDREKGQGDQKGALRHPFLSERARKGIRRRLLRHFYRNEKVHQKVDF